MLIEMSIEIKIIEFKELMELISNLSIKISSFNRHKIFSVLNLIEPKQIINQILTKLTEIKH